MAHVYPTYKPEFVTKIGMSDIQYNTRYYYTWGFAKKFFEQQTKYIFICKDWELAAEMKRVLNIPSKYVYFNIRHLYQYVDMQEVTEQTSPLQVFPRDECKLVDYFSMESTAIDKVISIMSEGRNVVEC